MRELQKLHGGGEGNHAEFTPFVFDAGNNIEVSYVSIPATKHEESFKSNLMRYKPNSIDQIMTQLRLSKDSI